jgi:hypothetical protein
LTQEFFGRLLKHNWIAHADRHKGRFRSCLLMAMKRFLAKEWDQVKTLKRGGEVRLVPLQFRSRRRTGRPLAPPKAARMVAGGASGEGNETLTCLSLSVSRN